MVACEAVRQDDTLFGDVNKVYKAGVDNETPAKADEAAAVLIKLLNDYIFQLAKLVRDHLFPIVLSNYLGIVPVG